ncbi:hypothetical protein D3C87_1277510 [compost metagenome]
MWNLHALGQFVDCRRAVGGCFEGPGDAFHPLNLFMEVNRDTDGPGFVGDIAANLLSDPPRGVGREAKAAAPVVAVDGFEQADVPLLRQVVQWLSAVKIFFCLEEGQFQVRRCHSVASLSEVSHGTPESMAGS